MLPKMMNWRLVQVFVISTVLWNFTQAATVLLPANGQSKTTAAADYYYQLNNNHNDDNFFDMTDRSINPKYYSYFRGYIPSDQTPVRKSNSYFHLPPSSSSDHAKRDTVKPRYQPTSEGQIVKPSSPLSSSFDRTYYNPLCDVFGVCSEDRTPVYYPQYDDSSYYVYDEPTFDTSPATITEEQPEVIRTVVDPFLPQRDIQNQRIYPSVISNNNNNNNNNFGSFESAANFEPVFKRMNIDKEKSTVGGHDSAAITSAVTAAAAAAVPAVPAAPADLRNRSSKVITGKANNDDDKAMKRKIPPARGLLAAELALKKSQLDYHRNALIGNKKKAIEDAQRMMDYLIDLGTKRRKIPIKNQIMKIPVARDVATSKFDNVTAETYRSNQNQPSNFTDNTVANIVSSNEIEYPKSVTSSTKPSLQ